MHLVFLNQYYPPDVAPTGVMLEALVAGLLRDGHEVTVLCASGGYAGGRHETSGRKTARHKTQEEVKEDKLVAAVCDRRGHCGEEDRCADPRSALRVVRIGATRFGRGSFGGKLIDYLSFYGGVTWRLWVMGQKPERIVALTTPPYLSVVARLISKFRGGDHAHWVMDLYPDVMVAHGMLREAGVFHRVLAGVAKWGFGGKRCAAILTLGPDMADRVTGLIDKGFKAFGEESPVSERISPLPSNFESRTLNVGHSTPNIKHRAFNIEHSTSNIHWVPLWGEGASGSAVDDPQSSASCALRAQRGWGNDELVVMYSGNMGLGHRFGEILKVAEMLMNPPSADADQGSRPKIRWVFFGAGKRRGEIEQFMNLYPRCPLELHGYVEADQLAVHLQTADLHLVSLDPAWTGMMVPSKLQGIFEAARPVVFIGSESSSIGRWVRESGGGWLVVPGDTMGLMDVLEQAGDRGGLLTKGLAAREFAARNFDRDTNVCRAVEVLTSARRNSYFEGFLPD